MSWTIWHGRGLALSAALVVAVTGVAVAAIPDSNGVIHACFKTRGGQLRVIDPAYSSCRPSERPLSWNQSGLQGPPGISGYEERSRQEFLPAGEFAEVTVSCSPGKKVLGGGFDVELPTEVRVYGSEPSLGGNIIDNGWTAIVQNDGQSTRQVTVTAICAFVQ